MACLPVRTVAGKKAAVRPQLAPSFDISPRRLP